MLSQVVVKTQMPAHVLARMLRPQLPTSRLPWPVTSLRPLNRHCERPYKGDPIVAGHGTPSPRYRAKIGPDHRAPPTTWRLISYQPTGRPLMSDGAEGELAARRVPSLTDPNRAGTGVEVVQSPNALSQPTVLTTRPPQPMTATRLSHELAPNYQARSGGPRPQPKLVWPVQVANHRVATALERAAQRNQLNLLWMNPLACPRSYSHRCGLHRCEGPLQAPPCSRHPPLLLLGRNRNMDCVASCSTTVVQVTPSAPAARHPAVCPRHGQRLSRQSLRPWG